MLPICQFQLESFNDFRMGFAFSLGKCDCGLGKNIPFADRNVPFTGTTSVKEKKHS